MDDERDARMIDWSIRNSCHYCYMLNSCGDRKKERITLEDCRYHPVSAKKFLERQKRTTDWFKEMRAKVVY